MSNPQGKICTRCTIWRPLENFHRGRARCMDCRNEEKREARAAAKDPARAARLSSDFDSLKPEDFDTSVANDGRIDPKAAREKRQEYSKAMGEFAEGLHETEGEVDLLPEPLGGYIGKLAEQERRFGNRRLARSVSLAAAHEALALRQFKQAASQYLGGKIEPTGYALRKVNRHAKRTVVLFLSDLHLGSNLSDLDNPIAFGAIQEARRLEFVVRQAVDFKPQYREASDLVLILGGDIIDGMLGHDFRDGAPLTEQKVIFWRLMSQSLALLSQTYPSVRVVCQPGNHGRDKLRHPGRATSSKWDGHEWQMYYALSMMAANLKNVTFDLPFRAVSVVDLHGSKMLVTHGDTEVKLGDPDTQSSRNAMILDRINATKVYGHVFDVVVCGHFHKPRYQPRNPRFLVNGALVPPNGYARSEGYIGEPCGQWLWEAVEGHPIGDLRFLEVSTKQDEDEQLGSLVTPFRFV